MANDYKTDMGKPPLLDALVPFYPALRRLALMMVDAAEVHKLNGSKDPFNEWRQLPDAKRRLANANIRHMLKGPWKHDDVLVHHPHAALALFNLLASLTLHEEEDAEVVVMGDDLEPVTLLPADLDPPVPICSNCLHPITAHDCGHCYAPGCSCPARQEPVNVPAGADWREKPPVCDSWVNVGDGDKRECRRDKGHKGMHEDSAGLRW